MKFPAMAVVSLALVAVGGTAIFALRPGPSEVFLAVCEEEIRRGPGFSDHRRIGVSGPTFRQFDRDWFLRANAIPFRPWNADDRDSMNEQFEHLADDHEAQMSVVAVYEIRVEGTAGSVADVRSVTCKAILPSRELLRDPNAYELLHIDDKSVTRWRLGR